MRVLIDMTLTSLEGYRDYRQRSVHAISRQAYLEIKATRIRRARVAERVKIWTFPTESLSRDFRVFPFGFHWKLNPEHSPLL